MDTKKDSKMNAGSGNESRSGCASPNPSAAKKRRLRDDDNALIASSSASHAGDDSITTIRDLKRDFESAFTAADLIVNQIQDLDKANELFARMAGMYAAFSNLLLKSTALATGSVRSRVQTHAQSTQIPELRNDNENQIVENTDTCALTLPHSLADSQTPPHTGSVKPQSLPPAIAVYQYVSWLEQLLRFCPLRDLFAGCMAVNREWNSAAKASLKNRKSLKLSFSQSVDHEIDSLFLPSGCTYPRLKSMGRGIQQMTEVTHVQLIGVTPHEWEDQLHRDLTLMVPKLQKLTLKNCDFGQEKRAIGMENLRSLSVSGVESLSLCFLPGEKIASLHIVITKVLNVVNAAWQMGNVTRLRVFWDEPFGHKNREHAVKFISLFRKLTLFDIDIRPVVKITANPMDEAIAQLVENNRQLEEVSVSGMTLTDQSLISLARLKNLKVLTLKPISSSFSETAFKILLNERSQNGLKSLTVDGVRELSLRGRDEVSLISAKGKVTCNVNGILL